MDVEFSNPQLQEVYTALKKLFPNVGWQIGESDEMICLPIVIRNNAEPTDICHKDTLWISVEGADLFGYFESNNEYSISFAFEKIQD